jgi:hypothetical protein
MKQDFLNTKASTSYVQQADDKIDKFIEFTTPHILKMLNFKEAKQVDNKFFKFYSHLLTTHQFVINKFRAIPFLTVRHDISESLFADFGMFTNFFETIADKDSFKYFELLHILYCFALEIVVAYQLGEK